MRPRLTSAQRPVRLIATGLVSFVAFLTFAPLAQAATPAPKPSTPAKVTTFGIQPASATSRDSRPALVYGVTQGASLKDHVSLVNYSRQPLRLSVYAADATTSTDGTFSLKSGTAKPTETGSWITLDSKRRVTVPARTDKGPGQVIIPLSVKVPMKATPGDQVAGIVASLIVDGKAKSGAKIKLDQRVATRMYLRVSGKFSPELTLDTVKASFGDTLNPIGTGKVTITYTVRNTGNVRLNFKEEASVSNALSSTQAKPRLITAILSPGNSVSLTTTVDDVRSSAFSKATVKITPVDVKGDANPKSSPVSKSVWFWAAPWTTAVILAALAALVALVAFLAIRARGAKSGSGSDEIDEPVPSVDA